ncbi:MAG: VTT domain-containing protein [Wenzhouxiangellaceae bacterium]|nr:VTT domain-containing protein [Wenzhouxiangellaceae bacterium]
MKIDRKILMAWAVALVLVGASLVGGWLLAGESGQSWHELLGELENRSAHKPLATAALFIAAFALTTALTLPTATILCVAAGYVFGTLGGTLVSLAGALGGAMITFFSVRFLAGEKVRDFFLRGRSRHLIRLLERDSFFYLVVFRIVPVAPFFAINAAGAMIRISARRYLLATGLGLAPIVLIYSSVGAGIETVLQVGQASGPQILLQPQVFLPLLALITAVIGGMLARLAIQRRRRGRNPFQSST